MGYKFNPFSGNFDIAGSGGGGGASYIDGEVQNFSALPQTVGSPAVDSAYLVREAEGAWLLNRKPAGIYIRTANTGVRASDWTYAGEFPDVFSDDKFVLYDETDSSKNLVFQLSGISTGTTRTLTAPNASGTIALTSDIPAAFNPAAPGAIGGTTPSTGAFTTLSAAPTSGSALTLTGGTVTASAPLISGTQTWNDAAVTFTSLLVNVTNTASASASLLANFQVGGTSVANIRRDGRVLATSFALVSGAQSGAGFFYHSATEEGGHVAFVNNSLSQMWTCTASRFRLAGDLSFGRSVGLGQGVDTVLVRDDAGILAQRNGTNAQESRLYGTFTSSTNYQRMTVKSVRQTLSALSGASATTTGTFIPDGAVVVGVTTRVATLLTGATGYTIGDGTDADRWGDITGTAIGTTSDNRDWTAGTIECFTAGGNVTLTAKTANFTAGAIEICVFYLAGEAD